MICELIEDAPFAILRFADVAPRFWVETALQFGALMTGIVSRNKRVNIAALLVIIGVYANAAIMSFIEPIKF